MGFLRFILAVSVVIAHASSIVGLKLVGGAIAVETFFIISGFYMALILTEKYVGKGSYKAFIQSRFLRLFPTYWVVLIIAFSLSVVHFFALDGGLLLQSWMQNWQLLNIYAKLNLFLSNIFIFGQDVFTFLQIDRANGWFSFAPDFTKTEPQLHTFLLIPQAWSLSVELVFYTIAPFLVSRNLAVILIMMFASAIVRIALYSIGFDRDPWTYRFFPSELLFFLAGIISYRIYAKFKNHALDKQKLLAIMVFVYAFTIGFQFIPGFAFKQWIYYAVLTASIPFIFIYTQRNKADRMLGELSYPIYITHLLVITVIERTVFSTFWQKVLPETQEFILNNFLGILALIFSTLFSILLIKLVVDPLEIRRQGIAKRLQQKLSQ